MTSSTADDVTFTVDVRCGRLKPSMSRVRGDNRSEKDVEELFLANVSLEATDGSIILSANQFGGQIATSSTTITYRSAAAVGIPCRVGEAHLADVNDPEFSRTPYHKRMGLIQVDKFVPLRTTAVVFVHSPKPILTASDEARFLGWADCNKLRYEPCRAYPFIPSLMPDRVGSRSSGTTGDVPRSARLPVLRPLHRTRTGRAGSSTGSPLSPLEARSLH